MERYGKLILIACCDKNNGIGRNNDLLERIPEDMEFFQFITSNSTVVMGRNTFESMRRRPLQNRNNIVITSNPRYFSPMGRVIFVDDTEIVYTLLKHNNVYVIGGEQIYRQFINDADIIYITRNDKEYADVETFFPEIDERKFQKTVDRNKFKSSYLTLETYVKRKPVTPDGYDEIYGTI